MLWETATRDDSLSYRFVKGGMHFVSDVSHLESKILVLENMFKGYLLKLSRHLKLLWCFVLTVRP